MVKDGRDRTCPAKDGDAEGGDTLQQTCKQGLTRFDEVVQYLEKNPPRIVKPRQASIACLSCSGTSRYAGQGQGQGQGAVAEEESLLPTR